MIITNANGTGGRLVYTTTTAIIQIAAMTKILNLSNLYYDIRKQKYHLTIPGKKLNLPPELPGRKNSLSSALFYENLLPLI